MLCSIILRDYTTFIKETCFDFRAVDYDVLKDTNVSNNILKGALFVGENASGKSQVLLSIKLLLGMLLENSDHNYAMFKSMYTKGSNFGVVYVFNIDNDDIKYEVSFEANFIKTEKLYINDNLIIDRIMEVGRIFYSNEKEVSIDMQLSLVRQEYYNTKFERNLVLNKWFDYLKNSIYINCLKGTIKSYNPIVAYEQIIKNYFEKNNADKLNKFLKEINYGSEIVVNNENKIALFTFDKKMIGLKKKGTDFVMPLPLESAGNQSLVNLILPIIFSVKNDCMLIIDEFSSGLHNELEECLVKYFFNNSNDSQLFFTSHSTNLLDTFILRPDQIYSFKFDPKHGTVIKRFSDEKPRVSQNIEKMYLSGVFDGMPKYNNK